MRTFCQLKNFNFSEKRTDYKAKAKLDAAVLAAHIL